ncbi:hypothetical protein [Liberiplasma polymorphum]|uniref:hypothetical protein n=1 Tax=Liberiplasma polymorphum TaxID=3374570 RepID=UPI003775DB4E
MKRRIVFLLILSLFMLSACNNDAKEETTRLAVTDITINQSLFDMSFYTVGFNVRVIPITVTYEDESTRIIYLHERMISEEDLEKLSVPGIHEIHVTYHDVSTSFLITIIERDESVDDLPSYEEATFYQNFKTLHEEALEDDRVAFEAIVLANIPKGLFVYDGEHFLFVKTHITYVQIGNRIYLEGTYNKVNGFYQLNHVTTFINYLEQVPVSFTYEAISIEALNQLSINDDPLLIGAPFEITGEVLLVGPMLDMVYITDQEHEIMIYFNSNAVVLDLLRSLNGKTVTLTVHYLSYHENGGNAIIILLDEHSILVHD